LSSINDILSYIPLTEAVQTIKGGLPRVLPEEFWSLSEDVPGTKARLIEFNGQRQSARISPNGAPPKVRGKLTLDDKALILLSSTEEMEFTEELENVLCDWEEYRPQQDWAMRNIAYQGEGLRMIFENLETAAVLQTVATGNLYFDFDGNILPSSSGADLTVNQGIPAANIGQLNGLLTGDFNNPNFDIVSFISQKLIPRSLADTNFPIETMIYGANISGYLASNNYTKLIWGYQASVAESYFANGLVPPGFLGLNWIPASKAYFVDQFGNAQFIFPSDQITCMPKLDKRVWTFYKGSTKIPTQFGPLPTGEAALKSFTEITGRYRFAYIPQGGVFKVIDVGGCKFLPRFKVPGSTYLLSVNP
jgi:hypothetical protein